MRGTRYCSGLLWAAGQPKIFTMGNQMYRNLVHRLPQQSKTINTSAARLMVAFNSK